MKRGLNILLFVFLSFILISLSFVSAIFVTGNDVRNVCSSYADCPLISTPSPDYRECNNVSCGSSAGLSCSQSCHVGGGYNCIRGECILNKSFYDCQSCPNGCSNGACIQNQTTICRDSDGGINYSIKGNVTQLMPGGNSVHVDSCTNGNIETSLIVEQGKYLHEFYCSGTQLGSQFYECPYGCKDGACMSASCVQAGQAGPNPSLGPNDPYKDRVCCDGLKQISQATSSSNSVCIMQVGGGTICSDCGNGICESWENKCNCAADCTNVSTCNDSDGGYNIYVKGTLVWNTVSAGILTNQDYCTNDYLTEYGCKDGASNSQVYTCPNGCSNGACIKDNKTCKDSDGINYYIKGNVTQLIPGGKVIYFDSCTDGNTGTALEVKEGKYLHEIYCNETEVGAQFYACPNGCRDGACIKNASCNSYADCPLAPTLDNKECNGSQSCHVGGGYNCIEGQCVLNKSLYDCESCSNGCKNGACVSNALKEIIKCDNTTSPSSNSSLNLFFVGSGYNSSQLFCGDKCNLSDYSQILENDIYRLLYEDYNKKEFGLFSLQPFNSSINKINIYMVKDTIDCDYINSPYCQFNFINQIANSCHAYKPTDHVYIVTSYPTQGLTSYNNALLPRDSVVTFIHEFGHTLGLWDVYSQAYAEWTPPLMINTSIPNCDNTPGCSKWCTGEPLPPFQTPCSNFSNEQDCKANPKLSCIWLEKADPYFKTRCVKNTDMDNHNIGTGCMNGTGCYWGCNMAGYRSTPKNNFALDYTSQTDSLGIKHAYEPVSEKFVKDIFDCCYPQSCGVYNSTYCTVFSNTYPQYAQCSVCLKTDNCIGSSCKPKECAVNADCPGGTCTDGICVSYPVKDTCTQTGGIWKNFSNGCADSCDFVRGTSGGIACTQVITQSCDCGSNMCWTGKQCELNNVTRPFTCNSGCTLNNKCYPYGYRKSSQYCKEDSQFTKQTENNIACENNFECKSNVCVDNKCINQGLFEKFLNWFRSFSRKK